MLIWFSFAFYHSDKVFKHAFVWQTCQKQNPKHMSVCFVCYWQLCLSVCLSGIWLAQTCQKYTHTFHCMNSTLGLIIYLILSYTLFILWTEFRPVSITRHTFTSVSLWHTNLETHTRLWTNSFVLFLGVSFKKLEQNVFVFYVNCRIWMVLQTICSCVSWISIY